MSCLCNAHKHDIWDGIWDSQTCPVYVMHTNRIFGTVFGTAKCYDCQSALIKGALPYSILMITIIIVDTGTGLMKDRL